MWDVKGVLCAGGGQVIPEGFGGAFQPFRVEKEASMVEKNLLDGLVVIAEGAGEETGYVTTSILEKVFGGACS